mgnify:CR=1 FL=1|jgi:hypothetical protein
MKILVKPYFTLSKKGVLVVGEGGPAQGETPKIIDDFIYILPEYSYH